MDERLPENGLSEEDALALVAREYQQSPISAKLFGETQCADVLAAIERSEIIELDMLVLQGILSAKEANAYAAVLPEYEQCRRELYDAARKAGQYFDRNGRCAYYIEKCVRKAGRENPQPLFELYILICNNAENYIPEEAMARETLMMQFGSWLWGDLVMRFSNRVRSLDDATQEKWESMLEWMEGNDTCSFGPVVEHFQETLLNHASINDLRERYASAVDALPLIHALPDDFSAIATLSLERESVGAKVTWGEVSVSMAADDAWRVEMSSELIAYFWVQFDEDFGLNIGIDRSLRTLTLYPASTPLRELWPELAAKLEPLLTRFVRAHLEEAPVVPLVVHRTSRSDEEVSNERPIFDWKSFRDAQIEEGKKIRGVVPEIVSQIANKLPTSPVPTVEASSAESALIRLLGPPIRSRGSHRIFVGRSGARYPFPVHPGQDVGIGLLKKCLRAYDVSMEEFLAALR